MPKRLTSSSQYLLISINVTYNKIPVKTKERGSFLIAEILKLGYSSELADDLKINKYFLLKKEISESTEPESPKSTDAV